ncbi:AbrB/MazE/SpoVT family DNA-binding domain-containing protein [Mesorhizobium sp. ZC-5]|uniref:AbrB/MazE/SpoVT family DNA-binding domain-containing protein n=1 Tax=Mesorhizobium sp. ZC-5 TaxID=2986066 RepID=UPI0021E7A6C5|nr:AbrB/MazE/SpoVT family DNA-binding domain-containing protein [Mesorhizobium sp. ZC-5]MCV3240796.1 AbrB/MazE/SpoVT family DNA-binding domain-containing protein [Mesorhizobium sp. ZC-5]
MNRLRVDAKGQIILPEDLLRHLGIKPGQQIDVDMLPDGRIGIQAAPSGTIDGFIGLLAGKTEAAATIEEIQDAISDSWAGRIDV